ncbi:DNA methylase [Candidatus Woesearchaeota archaeon]|nr:MAG: DNA methylase [Candidatus Woesearchaeota archaeon]
MHISKKSLAVELSRLKTFTSPKVVLEQYPTDSEAAATVLWAAYMRGDIEDNIVADLGAGTGILGIGAYLLGAKGVYFVEKDPDAICDLKENLARIQLDDNYTILEQDVCDVDITADIVLQNPPFGTRKEHADKLFLECAKNIAPIIYSVHKTSTLSFVKAWAKDNNYAITLQLPLHIQLKKQFPHQTKKISRADVTVVRLEKIKNS